MINSETMQEMIQCLIKLYKPESIYLFGSYAWGQPDEDSDLDFLIIIDTLSDRYKALVDGYKVLSNFEVPKDLLVVTPDEFKSRSQNASQFMHKIKYKGKQVYARS